MKKTEKFLVGTGLLLLTGIIAIPFTTNALPKVISGSDSNYSGNNVNTGNAYSGNVYTGSVNTGSVNTGNAYSGNYATLTNKLKSTVEFKSNETTTKVVFDGTYRALKDHSIGGVTLWLDSHNASVDSMKYNEITFHLYINGKEVESEIGDMVGHSYLGNSFIEFNKINVKRGETLQIKIEGELNGTRYMEESYSYRITFHDDNRNNVLASARLAPIKITKNPDTFSIQAIQGNDAVTQENNTVFLRRDNQNLAQFKLKPSNASEGYLESIILQGWKENTSTRIDLSEDVRFKIDGVEIEPTALSRNHEFLYKINKNVSSIGATVEVISKRPLAGKIVISIYAVNDNYMGFPHKYFTNRYENVLVRIDSQSNLKDATKYTLGVDKYEGDNSQYSTSNQRKYRVSNLKLYTGYDSDNDSCYGELFSSLDNREFDDGDTFTIDNGTFAQTIKCIKYEYDDGCSKLAVKCGEEVIINRDDYPDYFRTKSGDYRKLYAKDKLKNENSVGTGDKKATGDEDSSGKGVDELGDEDAWNKNSSGRGDNELLNKNSSGKGDNELLNKNTSQPNTTQSKYSAEMLEAYEFAYENGITKARTIDDAKMKTPLTRIAMAKMLSNYATHVLGMQPDISKGVLKFEDVSNKLNKEYDYAVNLAYQLGIMGQNTKSGKFRPYDKVTRAEFITALSRMLYGTKDGSPYYITHLNKLKEEGIINSTKNPGSTLLRGHALLMLMRTAK